DVYIAGLSAPDIPFNDGKYSREFLIDLALRVVNGSLENKPADLTVTTHLCRGNYESTYAFEGSYDIIAPTLFAKEKIDGFYLEYAEDPSGVFKAVCSIPKGGRRVGLGVVSYKFGDLEDRDEILARIHKAADYFPHDHLGLCPQCGFSST